MATHCKILIIIMMGLLAGCSRQGPQPTNSPTKNFARGSEHASTIEINALPQARRTIVGHTLDNIGASYAWGGTSPETGFDCSGLVVFCHKAAGINIPRTARAMFGSARTISPSLLLPGDLVFFQTANKSTGFHVGIFIGSNLFVHAPGKGRRVRQTALDNPYFKNRFIGAGSFL